MSNDVKKACAAALTKVLANTAVLYMKTHGFHWNVAGPNFPALHAMFEEQYTEMWGALDEIAERIRALDSDAPGSFAQMTQLADIAETNEPLTADEMVRTLIADSNALIASIIAAIKTAQEAEDEPTVGLLTDRQTVHEKSRWMLKSISA